METIEEFTTITNLVEKLLKNDVRCRNDDKWLTFRVMQHFTNIFIPFEDFKKIPAFSTVDRCRRMIQREQPELQADEKTQFVRDKREEEIKEIIK